LKEPIGGPFESPPAGQHWLGPIQRLGPTMRRYDRSKEVDYCIIGVGAAGGVLAQRLARAGFSVVGLEAGPFWNTERDWVSDESGSHKLYWEDLRITGGTDPLAFGANNSGKGVGGALFIGLPSRPGFIHPISKSTRAMVWALIGPFGTKLCVPTMSSWNSRCPSRAQLTFRGDIRTAIHMAPIPWEALEMR